jgi:hypothetical protein
MSSEQVPEANDAASLELAVNDLLRRARPLPPHEEMVLEDLDLDEGDAFLAALEV